MVRSASGLGRGLDDSMLPLDRAGGTEAPWASAVAKGLSPRSIAKYHVMLHSVVRPGGS